MRKTISFYDRDGDTIAVEIVSEETMVTVTILEASAGKTEPAEAVLDEDTLRALGNELLRAAHDLSIERST